MQPQKYVAVAREYRPERLGVGWRQRIVCAVAAVVEQHGRKWAAARRTPDLRAERQRTASHVDHLWGPFDSLRRVQSDDDTNHADDEDGAPACHGVDISRARRTSTRPTSGSVT
jgi:hypothetical protein